MFPFAEAVDDNDGRLIIEDKNRPQDLFDVQVHQAVGLRRLAGPAGMALVIVIVGDAGEGPGGVGSLDAVVVLVPVAVDEHRAVAFRQAHPP